MRRIKINARSTDPETSWEAARSIKHLRYSQRAILDVIRRYEPVSDEEIYRHLLVPMSPSGARTRRKELVTMGLVRDSGRRDLTTTGRRTILWESERVDDDLVV